MEYRNLAELHRRQAERLGPRPALRFRRRGLYHDLSWQDYRAQSLACAAALIDRGVAPGDRVGLLSDNRPEWLVADMGILAAGAVNVPPHAPLTAAQIRYQFANAGVTWVIVSGREQLAKVRQVRAELPALRGVIAFDRDAAAEDCAYWGGVLTQGRHSLASHAGELERRERETTPDTLATVMYTSGTTGEPKGVMLTHGNLLSNALASNEMYPRAPESVLLSWLPYSHIYARTVDHYLGIVAGVLLVLADSAETVAQQLPEVRPTHISCVPRFYEKLWAALGTPDPAETGKRLRGLFGPRIDWLGSGGAPLPPPIAEAYKAVGLLVLQGYGLTESSPVISFNHKASYKLDTVGRPIPGVEVRIAADGEVLTRGPHVMKGYWNDPTATAEALRDGWLHTGDLGSLDADGFLKITGRKKELLVMSSGKKVVPPHIEGLLLADDCIDQAVVHGEGRNFLTALVVPHWANVRRALGAEGTDVAGQDEEALARHPAVRDLLQRRIDAALRDVSSWERVKKFVVLPRPFSVAAEELTVSLKLRRNVVFARYSRELESLYTAEPPE